MLTYWLNCEKVTDNVDQKVVKTRNGRTIPSSKCAVHFSKKSRFLKEQEAKELLSGLGIKTLSKIQFLGKILF